MSVAAASTYIRMVEVGSLRNPRPQRGAPHQEQLTGKFLLDLGSAHPPVDQFSRLLHQAKAAVRLCGDCSTGLETEEPVLGNRGLGHGRCG